MTNNNPIFRNGFIKNIYGDSISNNMFTISGVMNKSFINFGLLILSFFYSWSNPSYMLFMISFVGSIASAMIFMFLRQDLGYIFVPLCAFFEGIILGMFSIAIETYFPGIAFQAVSITLLCFFGLLFAYKFSLVEVTDKFRSIVMIATFSIAIFYFINFLLSFIFGMTTYNSLGNVSIFSIVVNLVIVVVASLNLLLDFDFIYKAGKSENYPVHMEWYAALGLMFTLVWMYIEIANLLLRMRMFLSSSDN